MDYKEMAREILESFFIIFTCTIMVSTIYVGMLGSDIVFTRDIFGTFVISVLTSLAGIVTYSKRELKRAETFFRHAIHFALIMIIGLGAATYMGWILWSIPITVFRFSGMIVGIYVSVYAIIFYQSKKLTDKMNEKLKERYK